MIKIQILVAYSGGKDSQAALLWAIHQSGYQREAIKAVFCDTKWEHPVTYKHVKDTTAALGVELVTLTSKKYDGMIDLAKKKGRFPSSQRRFCTEELKTKPMIDYILDECAGHVCIIQGIRRDESKARNKMQQSCTFFKYYFQPYGHDKNGKAKFHTYRKDDVIAFRKRFLDDVQRPMFEKTGQEVIDVILGYGMKPNPLYYRGLKRVGCYPFIMCSHGEVLAIAENDPEYEDRLINAELEVNRTFFAPNMIPARARNASDTKSLKLVATARDVFEYVKARNATGDIFKQPQGEERSCMSYYSICE